MDVEEFEEEFAGAGHGLEVADVHGEALGEVCGGFEHAVDVFEAGDEFGGGDFVADDEGEAGFELFGDVVEFIGIGMAADDVFHGFADHGEDELVFGALAVFAEHEFDFAARAGDEVGEVAGAGHDAGFVVDEGAVLGAGDEVFKAGDAGADADAGGLVDVGAGAGLGDECLDDLVHDGGEADEGGGGVTGGRDVGALKESAGGGDGHGFV